MSYLIVFPSKTLDGTKTFFYSKPGNVSDPCCDCEQQHIVSSNVNS